MSERAMVKQADLARVLRAADKAGVQVSVVIERGRMIVTPIVAAESVAGNSFDGMFE